MNESIDFVGIGAARCGTSWIANILRAHPQVCMSEPKEVRYFNRHEMPAGQLRGKKNRNFERSSEWYFKRFRHAADDQVRGEFSPIYLADAHAPARLYETLPDTRLIASLRNPVDRAFSLYRMHRSHGRLPDIGFEEALEREPGYLETGMYATQLRRFLEFFPRDRLFVTIFEELIRQPEDEFSRLFSFLGVDPNVDIEYSSFHTNAAARQRSRRLHRAAFRTSRWLIDHGFSGVMTKLRSAGAHTLFNKINAAPPKARKADLSDETRAALAARFDDDIRSLEKILGREVSAWR